MWYTIGTIGISALLVPMMAGFFWKRRKPEIASILSMILGSLTAFAWMIYGYMNAYEGWPIYLFDVEPLYPGLLVSFTVFILIAIFYKEGLRKWI